MAKQLSIGNAKNKKNVIKKKTTQGNSRLLKTTQKGSSPIGGGSVSKGYKKAYRGQGKK